MILATVIASATDSPAMNRRAKLSGLRMPYRDASCLSDRLPASADGQAYVKVRERASYEYAIVSAAAAVRLDRDLITTARVALGSVTQRPWRLTSAEAELPGTPLTREALIPVIERAMADAAPLPQNGFKVTMARNAAVRALLAAGGAS